MNSTSFPSRRQAGKVGSGPPRSIADPCRYVRGVGPGRASVLANLGIENVNDLLTHFPRTYYDRRTMVAISSLQPGVDATFCGRVQSATRGRPRGRRTRVVVAVADDTAVVQLVWFNQPYVFKRLKTGTRLIVSGRLSYYRKQRQVVNPEFEVVDDSLDASVEIGGRITPVYPLTSGVTQNYLRRVIERALEAYAGVIHENLPLALRDAECPSRAEALRAIHFPESESLHERAMERVKLEELFYMQLALSRQRVRRAATGSSPRIRVERKLERRFLDALGFDLTTAQRRVVEQIHADLRGQRGMNRLLQGDVGSGKTVVAGIAMLAAVEAGHQVVLMAPTEILAAQHAATLGPHFAKLGINVTLLTGSMKAAEKKSVHERLARGEIRAVIGTHALIQDAVSFASLGLVVIDEQHRFGVRQRAALTRGATPPHVLVMTATPIPRTLALTAYADLDLSVIDEMPSTRMPVTTRIVPPERREAMYAYIRERQAHGEQAYLLYPVIEDTEGQNLESAESAYSDLLRGPLKGVPVGLLHGRLHAADKDRVMRAFAAGDLRVLVATTVVEVGVHVPAATIMVVHHAGRFGLSQLHQLRGRVGRGGKPGYCFLLSGEHAAPDTLDRLRVLVEESDGFRIAEEDLRLRGPGEFLGVRQHGVPGFKLANPLRDVRLVERARNAVQGLLAEDSALRGVDGSLCREYLHALLGNEQDVTVV